MVIYSKLIKPNAETAAISSATGRLSARAEVIDLQIEDPIIAQETLFYDHRGIPIPNLVYYDTNTHRGKKRLPNGTLKDCFIKNVRVTIGQFGINSINRENETHIETIKEVVKSRVPGPAQAKLIVDIEERIREKRRQQGRPI